MLNKGIEKKTENDVNESKKDSENLPKLSKEKAEERDLDRPLH